MAKSAQVQSARDHYGGKRAGIRHRSHSLSQLASDGIGYVVACVCGHLCGMSSLSGASRSHSRGNARKTWHRRCTVWWRGLPGIEGQRISFPHSGTNSRDRFADAALCIIRLVWNSRVLKLFRVLQEIIVEEIVSDGIDICFPEPSRHKDALRKSRSWHQHSEETSHLCVSRSPPGHNDYNPPWGTLGTRST